MRSATLKDFPHLANKLACRSETERTENTGVQTAVSVRSLSTHINQYIRDLQSLSFTESDSVVHFWEKKRQSRSYSVLPFIAQDIVSAPSSQAFVERVFSTCGMMTAGRRNRMDKSLHMRVWLKANHNMLAEMGC
jgi:hypothetical protein